jgi:hypothetical protein
MADPSHEFNRWISRAKITALFLAAVDTPDSACLSDMVMMSIISSQAAPTEKINALVTVLAAVISTLPIEIRGDVYTFVVPELLRMQHGWVDGDPDS